MKKNSSSFQSNYSFVVPADYSPERIDTFVQKQLPDHSRTFIQKLIGQGCITLNNKTTKPGIIVKAHDVIVVNIPHEEPAYITEPTVEQKKTLEDLQVTLVYSDNNFAIIQKPAGLIVHRPSSYSDSITLVDWLIHSIKNIKDIGTPSRPGIIHRLDKDTSGLMLIARSKNAQNILSNLFKNREIQKTYLAIVQGHPDQNGIINLPIGRNPHIRNQMSINGIGARHATTHYKVVQYLDNATLLELTPITGRTHQIRVHLKALGHPIIGDEIYGIKSPLIKRQALHAHKLSFAYKGKPFSFEAPLPEDMTSLIKKLSPKN